jgi:hypothetical protein
VNYKKLMMPIFTIAMFFAMVIGCGFSDEESLENSSSTTGDNTAKFDITINSGELAGDEDLFRIKKNENVSLNFSSDTDITVHLHGYDIEKTVSPGNDQAMEFKANATGRFGITSHGTEAEHQDYGSQPAHSGTKTDPDVHAGLFESETLTSGDMFSYQLPMNIENTSIPYHDHMSHGAVGSIEVSSHYGESDNVLVTVVSGEHQFHPDNVIVKPGALIEWKIDSNEKVRLTSGLPPSDHANHESEEKTLIILEVYP